MSPNTARHRNDTPPFGLEKGVSRPASGGERVESEILAILDALSSAAVVLNAENEIMEASTFAYATRMFSGGAVTQKRLRKQVSRVRKLGFITEDDYVVRHADAAVPIYLRVRVAPLSRGKILILIEDRTKVRAADATRRDFVVNASHELKTPVGAISLLAETIHDHADDVAAVSHFSVQLQKESARLTKLVQEIISLSRLQDGALSVIQTQLDVLEIIGEAVDRVRHNAEAAGVHIGLNLTTSEAIAIQGDFELAVTALQNLLENAVRYSGEGARVSVGLRVEDNIEISVADTGIGIPVEEQERIFERFYRVDPARSRATGGTGLGLAIVKHIMADMGGAVEVVSRLGEGATFTLILPRIRPEEEEDD